MSAILDFEISIKYTFKQDCLIIKTVLLKRQLIFLMHDWEIYYIVLAIPLSHSNPLISVEKSHNKWPWGWLKNEYQEFFWGVEHDRRLRITSPPSVSQLSRQYDILNVSKHCRPPRSILFSN
jgi:hypothetical protein